MIVNIKERERKKETERSWGGQKESDRDRGNKLIIKGNITL